VAAHPAAAGEAKRRELTAGIRASLPVLVGVAPFGLITGVSAAAIGMGDGLAVAMSAIVFAGASQLAAVALLDAAAAWPVIVITALIINLRMVMYSAALEPHFRFLARPTRMLLAYLLTDQAFALSITSYADRPGRRYPHWYYGSIGLTLWATWMATTALGVLAGAQVPESWGLTFAVPLVFLALIFPAITDRATASAAVVAGTAALVAQPLPYNLGLVVAAVAGITTGAVVESRQP